MKKVIIKKGNYTDQGDGLDIIEVIKAVLNENGLTVQSCCQSKNLKDLNFADDTLAAAGGIKIGQLYHTAGILKIRLV